MFVAVPISRHFYVFMFRVFLLHVCLCMCTKKLLSLCAGQFSSHDECVTVQKKKKIGGEKKLTDKIMESRIQKLANLVFEDRSDIFTLHPLAEYSINRLYSYPSRRDVAAIYGNLIILHEKAECCSFNQSALVHKCCNAMSSIKVCFFFPPFLAGDMILLLADDSYRVQREKTCSQ